MMVPVRPHSAKASRPVGDLTYMGPCVPSGGDPMTWESVPRTPRSIGEMTYIGPSLRAEDFRRR